VLSAKIPANTGMKEIGTAGNAFDRFGGFVVEANVTKK